MSVLLGGMVSAPAVAALMAGAGRADVALTAAMLPLDGFGTIHDPLRARVLVIGDGARRVVIADIDQTSLAAEMVSEMREAVARATEAAASDVLVVASHTFSAPHLFAPGHLPPGMSMSADEQRRAAAYKAALFAALEQAATQAANDLAPARIAFGAGQSDVNVNRNVRMAEGSWLGADDGGPSDKALGIVRFERADGRVSAVLMNYAVQSAVMNQSKDADGTKGVTADLGGAAAGMVEHAFGDETVALFLTGAAGDQAPRYTAQRNLYDRDGDFAVADLGDAGYALVTAQGEHLSADAARATQSATDLPNQAPLRLANGSVSLDAQERPANLKQIVPSHIYHFASRGKTDAPYWIVQVGDVALVGVQAELSAVTGRFIRDRSPFPHTLVVTMVNGAAKYMPDKSAYDAITYEAMNSPFGPGTAEAYSVAIVATLKTMRSGKAR